MSRHKKAYIFDGLLEHLTHCQKLYWLSTTLFHRLLVNKVRSKWNSVYCYKCNWWPSSSIVSGYYRWEVFNNTSFYACCVPVSAVSIIKHVSVWWMAEYSAYLNSPYIHYQVEHVLLLRVFLCTPVGNLCVRVAKEQPPFLIGLDWIDMFSLDFAWLLCVR